MKKYFFIIIATICCLMLTAAFVLFGSADRVTVISSLTPPKAFVGNVIRYSVIVKFGKNINVDPPQIYGPAGLELHNKKETKTENIFGSSVRIDQLFSGPYPGEYKIAGPTVNYFNARTGKKGGLIAPDRTVKILTVLPSDIMERQINVRMSGSLAGGENDDAGRSVKGPIRLRIEEMNNPKAIPSYKTIAKNILVLLGVFALMGSVVGVLRMVNRKKRILSPVEKWIKKLEKLKGKDLGSRLGQKEYCAEISSLMLEHLREKYGLSEKEMTTEELETAINGLQGLSLEQKAYVVEIVKVCDLVKYSGAPVSSALPEVDGLIKFVSGVGAH